MLFRSKSQQFSQASGMVISQVEKTNQCEIKPPFFEKKVGRPTNKSRRKQMYELKTKNVGRKVTKHGMIITCSYCHVDGHNIAGCSLKKAGIPPEEQAAAVRTRSRAIPEDVSDHEAGDLTQESQETLVTHEILVIITSIFHIIKFCYDY